MYSKLSHSPTEAAARWSDSLKRLKSQRYVKRISPFITATTVEKKVVVVLSPKQKKRSKAAFFQKAISNLVQSHSQPVIMDEVEQVKTPELSINDDGASSVASSFSSSYGGDDDISVEIDDIVQRILDEEDGLSTDTDEEVYDDDIVEQALSRILQKKSQTCPDISSVAALDRPLPPLPQQHHQQEYDQSNSESEEDDDLFAKSVEIFKASNSLLKRYASRTKLTRAAATKGQVHLKRAATWLGLPVQKLLASPQVQNFGLLMSKKYNSVNMLSSLTGGDNLPVLSISNSTLDTAGEEEEKLLTPKQQQEQPFTKELIYGTDSDHFAFLR
jgi:hypothetical protein